MPLKSGSNRATISGNIEEMLHSYERTGRIGNTKPRNTAHARLIASAAAYDKSRKGHD